VPKPILTNGPADKYLIRYGVPFVPRLIERACGNADLGWAGQGTPRFQWRLALWRRSGGSLNRGIAILDQAIVDVLAASISRAAEW